jgi:glyoxylase-like metal-dependent hydrolase (beta-lactamase superfamily II)
MIVMLLTSHVYQFSRLRGAGIYGANIYLLVGDSLTLVDTGYRGRQTHIINEITKLGYAPTQVTRIIITHHHSDHAGSLAVMKELTGAKVLCHPADAPFIEGSLPQPGPSRPDWINGRLSPFQGLWATSPARVDELVNDGDELPLAGGIRIIHTPGHTPGSISLFLPKERLLIVGDLLSNSAGLTLPSWAFTVDPNQGINSIKKLIDLDFDSVCFGHGMPIMGKGKKALADFIAKMEKNKGNKSEKPSVKDEGR